MRPYIQGSSYDRNGSSHDRDRDRGDYQSSASAGGGGGSTIVVKDIRPKSTSGFLSLSEYRRAHDLIVEGADVPEPMQTFESVGFPADILDEVGGCIGVVGNGICENRLSTVGVCSSF